MIVIRKKVNRTIKIVKVFSLLKTSKRIVAILHVATCSLKTSLSTVKRVRKVQRRKMRITETVSVSILYEKIRKSSPRGWMMINKLMMGLSQAMNFPKTTKRSLMAPEIVFLYLNLVWTFNPIEVYYKIAIIKEKTQWRMKITSWVVQEAGNHHLAIRSGEGKLLVVKFL